MERYKLQTPVRPKRKGTFVKGDPRIAREGRPKGRPNKTTRVLREAILLAAEQAGEDGEGHDGLVGYLRRVANKDVKAFSSLLARVLPLQITGMVEHEIRDITYQTHAELLKAAQERGLPPITMLDQGRIPQIKMIEGSRAD